MKNWFFFFYYDFMTTSTFSTFIQFIIFYRQYGRHPCRTITNTYSLTFTIPSLFIYNSFDWVLLNVVTCSIYLCHLQSKCICNNKVLIKCDCSDTFSLDWHGKKWHRTHFRAIEKLKIHLKPKQTKQPLFDLAVTVWIAAHWWNQADFSLNTLFSILIRL